MADRRTWDGALRSPADVRRVLDQVNARGLNRNTTTALARAVQPADEVELRPDATRLLPVDERIAPLLPWPGLPRGATIAAVGSTSLLLLLLAGATEHGWAAVVGMPHLGALAAIQDHSIPSERLALVPNPGPDWPAVVAALIDGVDMVAIGVPGPADERVVRSLQARAREKGCALVPTSRWPAANVVLEVTGRRWEGLGRGRGRLKRQVLDVRATGRGAATRTRAATVAIGEPPVDVAAVVATLPKPDIQSYAQPGPDPIVAAHNRAQNEDPWAGLLHRLPKIERKRPWH